MAGKDPLVKDNATGEYKPRSTLWKAPNKRYYTSEEVYNRIKEEKAEKEAEERRKSELMFKAREVLYEIIGIPSADCPPGVLLKRERDIRDAYGTKAYYETVVRRRDEIASIVQTGARNGKFRDIVASGLYAYGIIRRMVPDVIAQMKREEKAKTTAAMREKNSDMFDLESGSGQTPRNRDLTELF